MPSSSSNQRRMIREQFSFPSRTAIREFQLKKLNHLIGICLKGNLFFGEKLKAAGITGPLSDITEFSRLPYTEKSELVNDHLTHPPFGTHLSEPIENYVRYHQTSGSTGEPLRWLDTHESWQALLACWQCVYVAAGIDPASDRVYFAFSFGPFLGFWTAFEAAQCMGMLCLPGGGLSSQARISQIMDNEATVLCCTPTYALRLAEVAQQQGVNLAESKIHTIIVAGEPGGAITAIREKITAAWGGKVRVFDHHGMTEVGPVTYEVTSPDATISLAVMEHSFLVEVIDPESLEVLEPPLKGETGVQGELVLTTLARTASPLLRYRTGDMVKLILPGEVDPGAEIPAPYAILRGGILGRSDDMMLVRGVNIYPSAIDSLLRQFEEVVEYRVLIRDERGMQELAIELELCPAASSNTIERIESRLKDQLALRVPVKSVPAETLPRFEMKARRFVRE